MDLIDLLKNLANKILKQKDLILTEEATKNAFILPFIAALGYDVFDPTEVIPEYTADIGTKKGEKVDYAIAKDGVQIMFFECKKCGSALDLEHASQLYRYFGTTSKTRVGVLTNGINYLFFSDLDEQNIMDKKPFLEFNILEINENIVVELKKLSKMNFNIDEILSAASELKYMKETRRILSEMLVNPSDEFVKFFATQIYTGVKTQKIMNMFSDLVKRSFHQFINDKINERLKSAMAGSNIEVTADTSIELPSEPAIPKSNIETTSEEIESYYIIKSILHDYVDIQRIYLRDFKSFCNIILDDSNIKVLVRLYYNSEKKQIALFDSTKKETKYPIEGINDIYKYTTIIKDTLNHYLATKEEIKI